MFKNTGAINAPALNCYEKCRKQTNIFLNHSSRYVAELFRREEFVAVHVDQLECAAATAGNAGQRVVGDVDVLPGNARSRASRATTDGALAGRNEA